MFPLISTMNFSIRICALRKKQNLQVVKSEDCRLIGLLCDILLNKDVTVTESMSTLNGVSQFFTRKVFFLGFFIFFYTCIVGLPSIGCQVSLKFQVLFSRDSNGWIYSGHLIFSQTLTNFYRLLKKK